jgi:CheY-like chemotaxis protein
VATILIVDDEQPVREYLAALVHEAGYQTLQAAHGREALEVVVAERPDLVLADVMLPIMGGVELCRRLKSNPVTASVPVLLMTSARQRPPDGGVADAIIEKPFQPDVLAALIEQWVESGPSRALDA